MVPKISLYFENNSDKCLSELKIEENVLKNNLISLNEYDQMKLSLFYDSCKNLIDKKKISALIRYDRNNKKFLC